MFWLRSLVLLALLAGSANAQTPGTFPANKPLSSSLLDLTFGNKMDVTGGLGINTTLTNPTIGGGTISNAAFNNGTLSGTFTGGTLSGTTLVNATFVGSTGVPVQSTVSCGTSTTQLLAAGAAAAFIATKIPATGSTVWFNYAGASATTATPSIDVPPGSEIVWSTATGFLPTGAINCIASGSPVSVSLVYK